MPPVSPADRPRRLPAAHPGVAVVAGLVGLAFLFPLGYLAWGTLSLGGDFWDTLASARTLRPLRNSLLIAASTAGAGAVLGTSLAWLVARTDLPGRRVWRLLLPLPLVIPSFVGATALLAAFGRGGLVPFVPRIEGFWGAFAVLTLLTYPYVYLPVLARLSTTSPSMEDAARLLGSRARRTVLRVVLPQTRDAVAAGTMLVFLYGLSDFGAVSLMRYDTITRVIFGARLVDRATALTTGLVLALLAVVVVAIEQRFAPRRRVAPRLGRRQVRYGLGAGTIPGLGFVGAVAGLALLAPVAVFVAWVVRGSTTVGVGYSGLGDGLGFLVMPALNSGTAAVVAGAVGAVVVLPVAYAAVRARGWAAEVSQTAITAAFALPGLVIALAVVFWAIRAPGPLAALYQTFPLLIFAYVVHFGAQSLRATRAAIRDVPGRYEDAARTLGAGAGRRFTRIDLPLMAPGLLTGAGLVLLSTIKELPATLLLAPIGFETLATRIWNAAEDGFFAEVGITSLVLIAISGVLTWVLILRRELRA